MYNNTLPKMMTARKVKRDLTEYSIPTQARFPILMQIISISTHTMIGANCISAEVLIAISLFRALINICTNKKVTVNLTHCISDIIRENKLVPFSKQRRSLKQ